MQDEITELPDKWYILPKNDEEFKIVKKWLVENDPAKSKWQFYNSYTENRYITYRFTYCSKVSNEFTLINFEQFKKWVLKEESLLEQAKKKYPVGTQFKTIYGVEKICTVTYDNHILHDNNTKIIVSTDNGTGTVLPNSAAVYGGNKWAEIIKPAIDSWCVKVTEENKEVCEKWREGKVNIGDVVGISNGTASKAGNKAHNSIKGLFFDKFITTEEFYEKIGHKVEKKSLVGRYLKVLKNDRKDHKYLLINYEGTVEGHYKTLEYPEEWMDISFRIKIGEFELMPEDFVPPNEKKYDYEVVHCTTQEEWDFVHKTIKSTQYNWFSHEDYGNGKSFCIDIKLTDCSQSLEFYQKLNAKIYSFQEWCEKFGHKPDFNKSIEKWSVGSYVVFVVDYGGHPKGSVSKITRNEDNCVVVESVFKDKKEGCRLYKDLECKWFPTLKEAKEFAKSLVEPTEQFTKPLTPEECYPNVNVGDIVSWNGLAGEYEVWKIKDGRFWIIYEGEKHDYYNYSLDVKGLRVVKKSNECYDGNKVNTYFRDGSTYIDCKPWAWGIDLFKTHQLTNKKGKKFSPIKAELINVKKLKIKK